jgi:hypothetical protein
MSLNETPAYLVRPCGDRSLTSLATPGAAWFTCHSATLGEYHAILAIAREMPRRHARQREKHAVLIILYIPPNP